MASSQMRLLCMVLLTVRTAGAQSNTDTAKIGAHGEIKINSGLRDLMSRSSVVDKGKKISVDTQAIGTLDGAVAWKGGFSGKMVNFGGARRSDSVRASGVFHMRPQAVHSEVCDVASKVCAPCVSQQTCWHGADEAVAGYMAGHKLQISVPPGTAGKYFTASIWTSCESLRSARFYVDYVQVQNATLSLFINGKFKKHLTQSSTHPQASQGGVGLMIASSTDFGQGKDAHLQLDISRKATLVNLEGFAARLSIWAHVDKLADACLDRTFCLRKLGDGSGAAFELRNSIKRQYGCLRGKPAPHLMHECSKWRKCFAKQKSASHEGELLKLLSAIFGPRPETPTPAPTAATQASTASPMPALQRSRLVRRTSELLGVNDTPLNTYEPGCTDPRTADAEAMECECLSKASVHCEQNGIPDTEDCFRTIFCQHTSVCASWKAINCQDFTGQDLLMRGAGASPEARATLDGTVAGKCTTETRL